MTEMQTLIEQVEDLLSNATPGPWNALPDAVRVGHGFDWICQMYEVSAVHTKDFENAANNAQLIAQAPELLRQLVEIVKQQQEALQALDVLLDFGEMLEPNVGYCFEDVTAINEAYRKAYRLLNPEQAAINEALMQQKEREDG
jgi:hypothetical protein